MSPAKIFRIYGDQRKLYPIFMETLTERLDKLKNDGYTSNFSVQEGNLYNSENRLLPKEFTKIDGTYRIEDDSDPMHQTVVYALSCKCPPIKGVLINSYGTYSEPEKDRLINSLPSEKR